MTIKEKCGIFAVNSIENAPMYCSLGLHALQHRGQEGAGIAIRDNSQEISSVYINEHINYRFNSFNNIKGKSAIGHVRYSTSGRKDKNSLQQPVCAYTCLGNIALAHNGNLINASTLREKLIRAGHIFRSDVDTEVLIHLIAISKKTDFVESIIDALSQIKGAYSLVIMTENLVIGMRDPMGIRPLALGKLKNSYVLSSESCAFDMVSASMIRDVRAGEMIIIDNQNNIKSLYPLTQQEQRSCIFEYIYFARPDSIIDGLSTYKVRKEIGRIMAQENQKQNAADVVVPVPDSGNAAALGYSQESNIPLGYGIIRNHYVGRTFIEPTKELRSLSIRLKHNANKNVLNGKRVILIDDSIVRGNTSRKIVRLIRDAGAKEIHMQISSPPMTHPCFYGVDTPDQNKLIANKKSISEIAQLIEVDTLNFVSINGLYKAVNKKKHCDACFTGNYII